jgi:hypothetical protein
MFKEGPEKQHSKYIVDTSSSVPRKLTTRDIALGIGRKATDAELEEYLSRPYGKSIPLNKAIAQIKEQLKKKNTRGKWK